MVEAEETEKDPVIAALAVLSEVATSSVHDLTELMEDLAEIRRNRILGMPWLHIISDDRSGNPLSLLTKIATNLARASGGFRRALALGLRQEGMHVTEVAELFGVSRQRVSALIRPRVSSGQEPIADLLS